MTTSATLDTTATTIGLPFTGTYSLHSSATLASHAGFVSRPHGVADGSAPVVDLAFPLDGTWQPVGVRLVQDAAGVRAMVLANPADAPVREIRAQLERILCLDHDGDDFAALGLWDEVVAGLHTRFPGVRPVLHTSPYESAARAIVMHRLARNQAAAATDRICEQVGERLELGDHAMHSFPAPGRLADLKPVPGLAARKVDQLRALGRAADGDRYTAAALRQMSYEAATAHLQKLAGVGPFSAELIMIRGVGDPDVFPRTEKSLHRAMAQAYNLGENPDVDTLQGAAEDWRPYRSWIGLLLRHTVE